jgi:hypothetical protein
MYPQYNNNKNKFNKRNEIMAEVVQVGHPEFNPQYPQRKKEKENTWIKCICTKHVQTFFSSLSPA